MNEINKQLALMLLIQAIGMTAAGLVGLGIIVATVLL